MKRPRALGLLVASVAASFGLVASAGAATTGTAPAPGSGAGAGPSWLPAGCGLVEIGPLHAGYQSCAAPAGFRAPNGYMLANTAAAPKVQATSGASPAP